jgi:DNA repair protein RecO (recombination protein O)
MIIEDTAIVIKYRTYSEKYFIVSVFSNATGRINGLTYRSKTAMPQPGDIVKFALKARLETHLGRISLEIHKSNSALQFTDSMRVYAMQSMFEILYMALPENHPYPILWEKVTQTIQNFYNINDALKAYCLFELSLLEELGFGLNLSCCAVTGTTQNLSHVSPKTGRAVCTDSAKPYINKLLKLPSFFLDHNADCTNEDMFTALTLTAHFIQNHLLPNKPLPTSRSEIIKKLLKN